MTACRPIGSPPALGARMMHRVMTALVAALLLFAPNATSQEAKSLQDVLGKRFVVELVAGGTRITWAREWPAWGAAGIVGDVPSWVIAPIGKWLQSGDRGPDQRLWLVINLPTKDEYGNRGRSDGLHFLLQTAELKKVRYDAFLDPELMNFTILQSVQPFAVPALAGFCADNLQYARKFCEHVARKISERRN